MQGQYLKIDHKFIFQNLALCTEHYALSTQKTVLRSSKINHHCGERKIQYREFFFITELSIAEWATGLIIMRQLYCMLYDKQSTDNRQSSF
jgi:hypothetical protein